MKVEIMLKQACHLQNEVTLLEPKPFDQDPDSLGKRVREAYFLLFFKTFRLSEVRCCISTEYEGLNPLVLPL